MMHDEEERQDLKTYDDYCEEMDFEDRKPLSFTAWRERARAHVVYVVPVAGSETDFEECPF